jgi:hypothetical protein
LAQSTAESKDGVSLLGRTTICEDISKSGTRCEALNNGATIVRLKGFMKFSLHEFSSAVIAIHHLLRLTFFVTYIGLLYMVYAGGG